MDSPSPLVIVLSLLILCVFVAGWVRALLCLKHGRPILETEPRTIPATGYDTFLLVLTLGWVLVMFVVGVLIASLFISVRTDVGFSEMTPSERIAVVQIDIVGKVVALLAAVPLVLLRFAPRWGDLKPKWHKVPGDLAIGFVGFCMLAVPVLILQAMLSIMWPDEKHPFIEVILADPDPQFLALAAFSAVVLAPLAEELFFRALLQGLFERLSLRPGWQLLVEDAPPAEPAPHHGMLPPGYSAHESADPIDHSRPPGAEETLEQLLEPPPPRELPIEHEPPVMATLGEENPFVAPAMAESIEPTLAERLPNALPAYWPIAVSSLIFALAHLGQGPAPIALFFFALGLGYVYRATHRVLPCIVIHFLLNAFSMLQLWMML